MTDREETFNTADAREAWDRAADPYTRGQETGRDYQWERGPDGAKRWLCVDRYFERATLRYAWRWEGEEFTTPAVHATLEDWVTWILGAGFRLCALREPRPTADAIRARPDLEDAARVPYYVMSDLAR